MKLTKNLRAVILRQFSTGDTIEYLADLYHFSKERVEDLIREEMIARGDELAKLRAANGQIINLSEREG